MTKRMAAGDRFGMWTVVEPYFSARRAICRCDCGSYADVQRSNLTSGASKSCDCVRRVEVRLIDNPTYRSWHAMVSRCTNQNDRSWRHYGGSGVSVFHEWLDFSAFVAYMGERPQDTTLDRIDNSRGYEPGNVRWASAKRQSRNRSCTLTASLDGTRVAVADLAEERGLSPGLVSQRLRSGWSLDKAIMTPRRAWHRSA